MGGYSDETDWVRRNARICAYLKIELVGHG